MSFVFFLTFVFLNRARVTRDADLRTKKENYEKRRGSDHRASRENNYSSRGSSSNSSRDSKRRKGNDDNDEFDPMDPSAYSDAPKGRIITVIDDSSTYFISHMTLFRRFFISGLFQEIGVAAFPSRVNQSQLPIFHKTNYKSLLIQYPFKFIN